MIFHELKYFLTLAECLNFSIAADKLYISQPGLSKMISGMERELGVKLFNRSTRKVELTTAGYRFYSLTKAYLEQCETISVTQICNTMIGSLSLAFGNLGEPIHIPTILDSFRERYPGVSVIMDYMNGEEVKNGIQKGKYDIGLLSSFCVHANHEFGKRLLTRSKLTAVVWPGHPFSNRKKVSIEELRNEEFILADPAINRGGDVFLKLCSLAGFSPKVKRYVKNFQIMYTMVAQKQGISFNLTNPLYDNLISIELDVADHSELLEDAGVVMICRESLHQCVP